MMRDLLYMAVLFAAWITPFAQQAAVRADTTPAAEAEIKSLELKLAEWIVHGQWDEYGSHLAADFVHTSYNGHVEGKEDALAALRDEHHKIIVMELEPADQVVRVYGDTAISNAEFTISVRESGQLKPRRVRLTHGYVRREGQWYLVAEQSTAIGK
jgi:hypothetical protein